MRLRALVFSLLFGLQLCLAALPAYGESGAEPDPFAPATPATEAREEAPPWANQVQPLATGSYYGHSGLNPYQAFSSLPEDEVFIADRGGRLDQYICRSGSPITFNLEIDRVYGAIAKLSGQETYNNLQDVHAMIANGLISPNATLYMHVYDVDHDYQGGDYAPEVDYVSINGHRLQRSLTSGNNRWDTVSFQVPIEKLLFPGLGAKGSEPAKAPNEIRVDIDVANSGDDVWCVEVDWAVLHLQAVRPAVLVNGILSNDHAWDAFRPMLWQRGLPNYAQELDATSGIFHNAEDLAAEMPDIKKAFGVDRINIIAHSKGGLDSRAYLRTHDDIDNLIQLATPNRGSDCAQSILGNLLGSTWDLDPDWIYKNFNYRDTRQYFWEPHNYVPNWTELGKAPIKIYAGTKFDTNRCPVGIGDPMDPPHDSVVSHDRATLPWNWNGVDGDGIDQGTTDAVGPYDHSEIHDAAAVADQVVAWLAQSSGPSANQASSLTVSAETAATSSSTVRLVEQVGGRLSAGGTVTKSFVLDGSSLAQVAVIHGKATTQVSLAGPDGGTIAPDLVGAPVGMNRATVFNLAQPASGSHTVQITAAEDDFWTLEVRVQGGMALTITSAPEAVGVGQEAPLQIVLTDEAGNGVAGAQVTAELYQPSGATQSFTLTDSGNGQYTGSIQSDATGLHVLVVRAVKESQQRVASAKVAVYPPALELSNPVESTPDVDGDGLFNALVFDFSVDLPTAGLYVLDGDLYDGQGQLIQRQSATVNAQAGRASIFLGFDGRTISAHGADGPYVLQNVVLTDVSAGGLPIAALGAPYSTQPYRAAQFQRQRLRLTDSSDRATDTDGDGLYNHLAVTLQFEADQPGYYQASGRLVTENGRELAWSASSAYLSGSGQITLYFSGQEIRAGGVDGPYRLIDLMVRGPQTMVIPMAHETGPYSVRSFQRIPSDLVVEPTGITISPASPAPGASVSLTAVVENRGEQVGGSFPVAFYLGNPAQGGTLIEQVMAAPMAAEGQQPITVTWNTPAQAGSHEVYVVVNANRAVREFDYSNNTSYQAFTLGGSDQQAPTTSATVDPAPNQNGWNNTPVQVTLTGEDESGVAGTEYNLDGAGWQSYQSPVLVEAEGIHALSYRSTDLAGNVEEAKSLEIRIDRTAPTVTIGLDIPGWEISGLAEPEGPIPVEEAVLDQAFEESLAQADLTISQIPISLLQPVTPQVRVTDRLDPNPTVTATLNGQPYTLGTPVAEYGEYELVVTAVDAAGNVGEGRITFIVADRPAYASHLRGLVQKLAAEIKAELPGSRSQALTAQLAAVSRLLQRAEEALDPVQPQAHGQLWASKMQMEAFSQHVQRMDLTPAQKQRWLAQSAQILSGIEKLLGTLDR